MDKDICNLYFYVTWLCNLKCKHCWVEANTFEEKALSVDAMKQSYDGISENIKYVKFSGGEPLLFADRVFDVARYIKNKSNVKIGIETNGTIIDDDIQNNISELIDEVSISLDGYTENMHESCRGVKGCFSKTIKTINKLISAGINTRITSVLNNETDIEEYIINMINFSKKLGVSSLKLNPIMNVGRAANSNKGVYNFTAEELLDIYSKYCKTYGNLTVSMMLPCAFGYNFSNIKKSRIQTCHCGSLISILPNGDVGLCGEAKNIIDFHFGNIYEDTIEQILTNANKFKNISSLLEGVCGKCMLKEQCLGGCRVDGFINGGSVFSPPYVCDNMYKKGKFIFVK